MIIIIIGEFDSKFSHPNQMKKPNTQKANNNFHGFWHLVSEHRQRDHVECLIHHHDELQFSKVAFVALMFVFFSAIPP